MADAPRPADYRAALIIDDDERVRGTLIRVLRWFGLWQQIAAASDGAEGLALARSFRPDFVLIDLWLPDGPGLDMLPALRALSPAPRVVVLTAEESPALRDQALAGGAAGYLLKTMPADGLLAALRALAVPA
jgi:DNA-binding NarL/FixJ family response regulator